MYHGCCLLLFSPPCLPPLTPFHLSLLSLHLSVSFPLSFVITLLSSPPSFAITSCGHAASPLTPITFSSTLLSPPFYPFLPSFPSNLAYLIPPLSSQHPCLSPPFHPALIDNPPPHTHTPPSPEVDTSVSRPYLPPLFAPVYIIDRQGCFSFTIHQHLPPLLFLLPLPTPVLRLLARITLKHRECGRELSGEVGSEWGMFGCVRDLCVKERACLIACEEHVDEKCTRSRVKGSMCVL